MRSNLERGEMAELVDGAPLLREYGAKIPSRVRNPEVQDVQVLREYRDVRSS